MALKSLGFKKDPEGFCPTNISLDLEIAETNSFKKHFPGCTCDACYFHVAQANHRHIAKTHKKEFETNKDLSNGVRCFAALSFLKQEEVIPAFESLEEKLEGVVPDSFISYFEKIILASPMEGKRFAKNQNSSQNSGTAMTVSKPSIHEQIIKLKGKYSSQTLFCFFPNKLTSDDPEIFSLLISD